MNGRLVGSVAPMVSDRDLLAFMRAIGDGQRAATTALLATASELATARLRIIHLLESTAAGAGR